MKRESVGNGSLRLPLAYGRHFQVWGGPFPECPPDMVGVKMAKEIRKPCSIDIPTPDFSVPSKEILDAGLAETVDAILKRRPVYVGCMAGRGRTGLFLAILAKTFGIENPVEYVRQHYFPHAVETDGQYKFVTSYQPPEAVAKQIKSARFWAFAHLLSPKNLTVY